MFVSLFDLFSIGVGPSSSHTVGPMRAARQFLLDLEGQLSHVAAINVELYGSLAMTGKGHATDKAILLGLEGEMPEGVDPGSIDSRIAAIENTESLSLLNWRKISFNPRESLIFQKGMRLPYHSNAMRFKAYDAEGMELANQIYYSVGGGFVVSHESIDDEAGSQGDVAIPYPFETCEELLSHCKRTNKKIWDVILENEKTVRTEEQIRARIFQIWDAMQESVKRGCRIEGILPGGLNVKRRAAEMFRKLNELEGDFAKDPSLVFDWISLYALAVNEENAAGGRIVTAPTNGASGVIPAVLHYYKKFTDNASDEGIVRFFLTATAIGTLYKKGASLSAAEMGCQGEVGVACSMAAAGLAAAQEGSNEQIENAAEIGMEHNLGLTCDPVAGLVQIPCIERNTMGAIKAINASRLALHGNGEHCVSLDQVISAMRCTGEDMMSIYKETSEGGLALHVSVNIPEC